VDCSPCVSPSTCNASAVCETTCGSNLHICGGVCVAQSPGQCGDGCVMCPMGAPLTHPTCSAAGACGIACNDGAHMCGGTTANPTCLSNAALESCGTSCTPCIATSGGHGSVTCSAPSPGAPLTCVNGCEVGYHPCGGTTALNPPTCLQSSSVNSCGSSCVACPAVDNGTATCDGVSCGFTCATNYHKCGTTCVLDSATSCTAACTACVSPSVCTNNVCAP
jgi:hypothetical protein